MLLGRVTPSPPTVVGRGKRLFEDAGEEIR
jgi:hypothetical protein